MSKSRFGILLLPAAIVAPVIVVGCPMANPVFTAYVVNASNTPIESLSLLNQNTMEMDNILDEPVPGYTFEVYRLPLSIYGSANAGAYEIEAEGEDSEMFAGLNFGTEPVCFVQSVFLTRTLHAMAVAGDTFAKIMVEHAS